MRSSCSVLHLHQGHFLHSLETISSLWEAMNFDEWNDCQSLRLKGWWSIWEASKTNKSKPKFPKALFEFDTGGRSWENVTQLGKTHFMGQSVKPPPLSLKAPEQWKFERDKLWFFIFFNLLFLLVASAHRFVSSSSSGTVAEVSSQSKDTSGSDGCSLPTIKNTHRSLADTINCPPCKSVMCVCVLQYWLDSICQSVFAGSLKHTLVHRPVKMID